jgi:hypothetical protein
VMERRPAVLCDFDQVTTTPSTRGLAEETAAVRTQLQQLLPGRSSYGRVLPGGRPLRLRFRSDVMFFFQTLEARRWMSCYPFGEGCGKPTLAFAPSLPGITPVPLGEAL